MKLVYCIILVPAVLFSQLLHSQEFEDVSKKFEVDGVVYKARMTQNDKYEFKIKIYQKVEAGWQKVYRKIVEAEWFEEIEVFDWNGDGMLDVKFTFYEGVPSYYKHFLLRYEESNYVIQDDFEEVAGDFEKPVLLSSNPMIYYSIRSHACSGNQSFSFLYEVRRDSIIKKGYVFANFCTENAYLKIYRVNENVSHPLATIPDEYVDSHFKGDFYDYISYYWRHHYEEFID